ncbi:hypothetical protein C0992_000592 [Termitomyces sp. T32_za158]|nr:hypothetical protein C0992_000592 [Termitomyces sp. T32_za158]
MSASHSCLSRLLTYYTRGLTENSLPEFKRNIEHLPDVSSWKGVLGLCSLCIYFELRSALINWDYAKNVQSFKASIKLRYRARKLVHWLFSTRSFDGPSGLLHADVAFSDIYCRLLAHQAITLVFLKSLGWKLGHRGEEVGFNPILFKRAVNLCIEGGCAWDIFNQPVSPDVKRSFSWPGPTYVVKEVDNAGFDFPYADGLVAGDIITAKDLGLPLVPKNKSSRSSKPPSPSADRSSPDVEAVSHFKRAVHNPGKRSRRRPSSSSDDCSTGDTAIPKKRFCPTQILDNLTTE